MSRQPVLILRDWIMCPFLRGNLSWHFYAIVKVVSKFLIICFPGYVYVMNDSWHTDLWLNCMKSHIVREFSYALCLHFSINSLFSSSREHWKCKCLIWFILKESVWNCVICPKFYGNTQFKPGDVLPLSCINLLLAYPYDLYFLQANNCANFPRLYHF